jgi:hypothetical protein
LISLEKSALIKQFKRDREAENKTIDKIIDEIKPKKYLYSEQEIKEAYHQVLSWFPDVRRNIIELKIPLIAWPQFVNAYSTNFKLKNLLTDNAYDDTDIKKQLTLEVGALCFIISFMIFGFLLNAPIILIISMGSYMILVWTGVFDVTNMVQYRLGLGSIEPVQRGYMIIIPRCGLDAYRRYNLLEVIIHELCHVRSAIKGRILHSELLVAFETGNILRQISAYEASKYFVKTYENSLQV